jgi:hypothetical protein
MRPFIFLTALAIGSSSSGQITFERVYDHGSTDFGFSVQQTTDGGYIMCGIAWNDSTYAEMILLKADDNGQEQWYRTFGTALIDAAYCVRQTSDNGYVICGLFSGFGSGTLTVIRTDPQGTLIWQRKYPGSLGRDIAYSIQPTLDGGFAVCGFTDGADDPDAYVIKIDGTGDLEWSRTIDLGGDEYANSIRQLDDGGFIVLVDNGEIAANGDIHLLLLNSDGNTLWVRDHGTEQTESARALWVNTDGGFIIAGTSGYPVRDNYLLRTDAMGNAIWEITFGETALDETSYDVQQTDDGGFIFGGRKEDAISGDIGMSLYKTDPNGTVEWERVFHRGNFSEAFSLDQTSDGGYVLFGHTTEILSENFASTDMYLVKSDALGYTGLLERVADENLNLFPNPASDQFMVRSGTHQITQTSLMDMSGRIVWEESTMPVRSHRIQVDGLPSGPYCVVVGMANGVRSKATVIIAR